MDAIQHAQLWSIETSLRWLDRLAKWRGRSEGLAAHLATGVAGEEAAYFFLRGNGFTVVARRWNDGPLPGDVDLIAWQGEVLCFIEVKTRSTREVATASSAVDREKRKTLRRLAWQYLRHLPEDEARPGTGPGTRFDIVTVYDLPGKKREIQLIPGAFGWSE